MNMGNALAFIPYLSFNNKWDKSFALKISLCTLASINHTTLLCILPRGTCNIVNIANKSCLYYTEVFIFPPHAPKLWCCWRVRLNTSTHMSTIVDTNTKVSTSSPITHMSGGEWWERKASGRGNRLPSLIIHSHFLHTLTYNIYVVFM